ncbi:MAG: hypothetical protein IT432_07190 [Phycisphaerales bacterium]|nr:hypothetical protein [Phycisphaerales bacterium]
MKKHGRVKSIARLTTWVLALLLPAMGAMTLWWTMILTIPGGSRGPQFLICVCDCGVSVGYVPQIERTDVGAFLRDVVHRNPYGFELTTESLLPSKIHEPMIAGVFIPLWMPWLVALGFSIWFYREHRREKQCRLLGACPGCGYSRTGLAHGAPCPECGSLPTPGAIG